MEIIIPKLKKQTIVLQNKYAQLENNDQYEDKTNGDPIISCPAGATIANISCPGGATVVNTEASHTDMQLVRRKKRRYRPLHPKPPVVFYT